MRMKLLTLTWLTYCTCSRTGRKLQGIVSGSHVIYFLTRSRHILHISNHQDVVQITSPPGGILNISVADPSTLKMVGPYVGAVEHESFVVASITAVTVFYNNGSNGICEICERPFFHNWPRFTAVLASVLGVKALHFHSWKGGIVFATSYGNSGGPKVIHRKNKNCAPIGSALLPSDSRSRYSSFLRRCGFNYVYSSHL